MSDLPLEYRRQPTESESSPAPAAIVLHGRGSNEADLLNFASQFPAALEVISLRAPTPLGPGYTWYELDLSAGGLEKSQPDGEDFRQSRELIDASVESAIDAFDLDPDRIGIAGFSQGSVVGMGSILERPDLYHWVAAHHGYLPATHHDVDRFDADSRAAFLAVGEADDVIPASRGEEAAERLSAAGLDVTLQSYPVGHGIGQAELQDAVQWIGQRY